MATTVEDAVNQVLAAHPGRHLQTEALMRERVSEEGKKWAFLGDIPRNSMNLRSGGNEFRLIEHIKKDKVAAISAKVAEGVVMPAVIVTRKGRKLVEGYHRWHGYEGAGVANIPAYEVDIEGDALDQFIIEITQMAGDKLTPEEVKMLSLRYLQRGFAESRIASMLNVPLSTLRQWAAISKLQQRLQQTGTTYDLTGWSNRTCGMLYTIRNLPTLVAAVELVRDAHLKGNEVVGLIQAIRPAQSQAEELQIIRDQRDAMEDRIKQAPFHPNGQVYTRPIWMQSVPALGLLTKYTAEQYTDTAPQDQVSRLMVLWAQVAKVAEEAVKRLGERGGSN
jgi:hypothetical protein